MNFLVPHSLSILATLMFAPLSIHAQEDPDPEYGRQMMLETFEREVAEMSGQWMEGVETLEDWELRRVELRRQLSDMLGLLPEPERTALQVKVTGTVEHDEFTVSNLHFQPLPGLYITANLYVPKKLSAPAPTVLHLCGHAARVTDGISYGPKTAYQHHPAWYARHGMVSFAIDTLNIGEIRGVHRGTYRRDRWWWYNRGYTPAAIEVWSAIRALDYLEARDDVDPARIGVTGRSGGGMYSWLLLALDDRPAVATPTAGITDLENHLIDGVIRGHCDCNYWNNFHRLDTPFMAALAAPRPVRLLNTDADVIFPKDGIHRVDEQVREIYSLYGKEDRWDVFIGEGPHGDTPELQEKTFSWMHRWLTDEVLSEVAPAEEYFSQEELRVLREIPDGEQNTRIDEIFLPARPKPAVPENPIAWERMKDDWMAKLAAKTFAGWPQTSDHGTAVARLHRVEFAEDFLEVHEFSPQEGVTLRLWTIQQNDEQPERSIVRVLNKEEWQEWLGFLRAAAPDEMEALLGPGAHSVAWPDPDPDGLDRLRERLKDEKAAVVIVAPRGIGPTHFEIDGNRGDTIRRSFQMLGQTLDGMCVWDVRRALAAIRTLPELAELPLHMEAADAMAGVVLYASLFDKPADRLELRGLPDNHEDGPYLMNIDRILGPPQTLAMVRDRTQVILRDTDPRPWSWSPDFASSSAQPTANPILPSTEHPLEVPPIRSDRPRLMFTPGSLAKMKDRVRNREEPWHQASRKILRDAERELFSESAPAPNTGRHSLEFYQDAVRDGEKARLLAYAWLLSGEDRFAEASLAFLTAWPAATPTPASNFDPEIRFPNTGMEVARAVIPFLESYDLLADHPAMKKEDRESIEAWFRMLVNPILEGKRRWHNNDYFNRQEFQNHLTAHTMGLAAIGYTLGDRELVQFALDHPDNERDFKTLVEGMILMPGDAPHHREPDFAPPPQKGEIHDRYRHFSGPYRGLQYAHLSLSQLLYLSELAWNNGIDFYNFTGPGGENLKDPLRFYADFYRSKDASLKGGFYVQDKKGRFPGGDGYDDRMDESRRIGDSEAAIWELGHRHYPGTPEIERLLQSRDRAHLPRHPHNYFFHPVLTHGEPLE